MKLVTTLPLRAFNLLPRTVRSMGRFSNQVIFVTGGTSGLGLEACQRFTDEGARVCVADLDERDAFQQLDRDRCHFVHCDVSNSDSCELTINTFIEKFNRLDVLFANAEILSQYGTVVTQPVDTFQRVVQTDMNSLFYLAPIAIPQMQKQGKGVIIATASTSGLGAECGTAPYCASKAGLINLCKVLAMGHGPDGIRVNTLCPGFFITPMSKHLAADPRAMQLIRRAIPMGRGGQVGEIAKVVLFLASDNASYITGQCMSPPHSLDIKSFADSLILAIVVDGGITTGSGVPNFTQIPEIVGESLPSKL